MIDARQPLLSDRGAQDFANVVENIRLRLRLEEGLGSFFLPSPDWVKVKKPIAALDMTPAQVIEQRALPPPAPPHPGKSLGKPAAATPKPPKTRFTLVPYVEPPPCPGKEAILAPLQCEAESCRKCGLSETRTHVAWGEGSLTAEVMFVGEGPGRDEDEQGRPFVGRAGKLLTDIIEKGMKIPRNQVYIANMVKCRPPGNRDPGPDEMAACRPYLDRQIEIVAPRVLVALGRIAGAALTGEAPRMGSLRGRWFSYQGLPLRVLYHPSFLLRARGDGSERSNADRETWEDVKEILQKLVKNA